MECINKSNPKGIRYKIIRTYTMHIFFHIGNSVFKIFIETKNILLTHNNHKMESEETNVGNFNFVYFFSYDN